MTVDEGDTHRSAGTDDDTDPGRWSTAVPGLRTTSLRRRVTVAVWLLLATMVLVLAVATGVALASRLDNQLRQRLADRVAVATALNGQVSDADLVDRLEGDGVSVILVTAAGERLSKGPLVEQATSGATASPAPPAGPAGGPGPPAGPAVVEQGDLYRVTTALDGGARLTLVASAADVRRTIVQVEGILVVGGLLVLAIGAGVLGPLVGRALQPLQQMTGTARSITAGDRGRRLRPTRPDTELGQTAAAFDAMLDAVEGAEAQARLAESQARDAEDRLRRFLSDVAHELRTPLAGARAATEQVLRSDPPRDQRESGLVSAIRENDRAARLVDDMLTMARIDQGLELRRVPVDLTDQARRAAGNRRLTAPRARLTVTGDPCPVLADPDRLIQIIGNLLDNAVRVGGPSTSVALTVTTRDDTAVLEVVDDGPGVPPAERERIFDRLVRLDDARARTGDADRTGFGLGLPIARGLARAHGGDLVCLPRERGAAFELRLLRTARPADPSDSPHP